MGRFGKLEVKNLEDMTIEVDFRIYSDIIKKIILSKLLDKPNRLKLYFKKYLENISDLMYMQRTIV